MVRKAKAGKGWETVQPMHWNQWNPGFMSRQWSTRRTGGKAKGQGQFGNAGKGGYYQQGGSMSSMHLNKLALYFYALHDL